MLAPTILSVVTLEAAAPINGVVLPVAAGVRCLVYGFTITDSVGGTLKLFFGADTPAKAIANVGAAPNGGAALTFARGSAVMGGPGEDVLVTSTGDCHVTVYYTLQPEAYG